MSIFDLHTTFTNNVNAEFPTLGAVKTNRPKTQLDENELKKAFVSKGKVGPSVLMNKQPTYEDILRMHVIVIERTDGDEAKEEAIMKFTEDIRQHYVGKKLTGAEGIYLPHEQISLAIYDYDSLDQDGVTLSVVEIAFKEWRTP